MPPLWDIALEGFPKDAATVHRAIAQSTQQEDARPVPDPVLELRSIIVIEHRPSPPHISFDTTYTTKRCRAPEGADPVRLASTSGHVVIIDEAPRHIMAGFEQEAIEKGCITLAPVGDEVEEVAPLQITKKRKSTKGKAKPRVARARFWSAVEVWVKSRLRAGQPGIDDFRKVAQQDPVRFDLDGKIDDHPSLGDDGKKYYCLATNAEVAERTVSNRLKEFYDKARQQRYNVTK